MGRVRKGRDIDAVLCQKGFRREVDGDHICYSLNDSRVKTKMSHGMMGYTLGPDLLALMSRQLLLTKSRFLDFIDCTISEEDYRVLLREEEKQVVSLRQKPVVGQLKAVFTEK